MVMYDDFYSHRFFALNFVFLLISYYWKPVNIERKKHPVCSLNTPLKVSSIHSTTWMCSSVCLYTCLCYTKGKNRRLLQKSAKEVKYMWQDFVPTSVRLIIIYSIYFLFMKYEICSQLWVQHKCVTLWKLIYCVRKHHKNGFYQKTGTGWTWQVARCG